MIKPELRKWITPLLILVIGSATIAGIWYYRTRKWEKAHILVELKPIQTPKGWGYDILTDGHIFIHQNIIPDAGGQRGFRTKEDALAVGQIVYNRVMKGELPMVTVKEMQALGVLPDTTAK